jgi:molybdopterin-guanine dinucleotide biosynthesis protein A
MENPQAGQRRFYQVAGFILAGGASTRMGQDKALLEVGGAPMLIRTARLLDPLVSRRGGVTVIADPKRYEKLGLRLELDDRPGQGPLGGIVTALRLSPCPWSLIVGCDLPYLTGEWLEYLIGRAVASAA